MRSRSSASRVQIFWPSRGRSITSFFHGWLDHVAASEYEIVARPTEPVYTSLRLRDVMSIKNAIYGDMVYFDADALRVLYKRDVLRAASATECAAGGCRCRG